MKNNFISLIEQNQGRFIFVSILWIPVLGLLWSSSADIDTATQREAFLMTHDGKFGYLIPVGCSDRVMGTEGEDFIRGWVSTSKPKQGKEVCLYSRQAFNRIFPQLNLGNSEAAHQRQALAMDVELQRPSRGNAIAGKVAVSIFMGLMILPAVYLLWRRLTRAAVSDDNHL